METADFFSSDAWKLTNMVQAILNQPYIPGRIGTLGLFNASGVTTTTVEIESKDGVLALLPTRLRGEAASQGRAGKAKLRPFIIPHIPHEDAVMASEVQNVRVFGGTELMGIEAKRDEKLRTMASKHDATLEYHRLGAVKGIILDADGSTIYNLFDEFGLSQTTVDFALGSAGTVVRLKCMAVLRAIEKGLNNAPYDHVHAVCGSGFFDKLTTNADVKDAYALWNQGAFKREDQRRGFTIFGITFEEYVGGVGDTPFVADQECHFFPVGVPELFKTWFAPGDFMETVNSVGLPRYARAEPKKYGRGMDLLTESNPLNLCTKPQVLVKGTTSS